MITKERIEELIKSETNIYWCYKTSVIKKSLSHYCKLINDNTLLYEQWFDHLNCKGGRKELKLNYLFENKKEAEHFRDFGNLKRTLKLQMPYWKDLTQFSFSVANSISEATVKKDDFLKLYYSNKGDHIIVTFTTKNYDIICEICKELFINGENDKIKQLEIQLEHRF